jgi:hypothetical protein
VLQDVDLSGVDANTKAVQFGISDGNPELPHFVALGSTVLHQDYVSVASKHQTHLLAAPGAVCRTAAELGVALRWDSGILCKKPLRRLQVWSGDQGALTLSAPGGGAYAMKFIQSCPSGNECKYKSGYGAVVLVGGETTPYTYALNLNRNFRTDPNAQPVVTLEFSDNIFSARFNSRDTLKLMLNGQNCDMSASDDRRFIGPFGPFAPGRGACQNLATVPPQTAPPTFPSRAPVAPVSNPPPTPFNPTAPPTTPVARVCQAPYGAAFPSCQDRIEWMTSNWKTAPKAQEYKDNGVDGSLCSIQTFLATVERFCPPCPCSTPSPSPAPTAKTIPPAAGQGPYPDHPSCESRIAWMAENWNTVSWTSSYVAAGVDGSRCSVQLYLATVEKFCPAPLVQSIEPPSSATLSPSSATLSPSSATPPDDTGGSGAIVGTIIGVATIGIFGGVAAVILVRRRRANCPIDDRHIIATRG